MHKNFPLMVLAVALLIPGLPVEGWSTKEHILLTRLAVQKLLDDPATPPAMKQWLGEATGDLGDLAEQKRFYIDVRVGAIPRGVDGLPYWAVMPDMNALLDRPGTTVAPFGVHEKLLHYCDLEYFLPADAPESPKSPEAEKPNPSNPGETSEATASSPTESSETAPAATDTAATASASPSMSDPAAGDLMVANDAARPVVASVPLTRPDPSRKPTASDIPRGYDDPRFAKSGMLPHRVVDAYEKTVTMLRKNRLADQPGQFPRDEHAVRWAGALAHYLQDSTQPQHWTADYKSRSFFPPDLKDRPDVHVMLEYRMLDDEYSDYTQVREAFWSTFVADLQGVDLSKPFGDPFTECLDTGFAAYDQLPLIGAAAVAAWKAGGGEKASSDRVDLPAFYAYRSGPDSPSLLEMKAAQQTHAVELTARAFRAAWLAGRGAGE